MNIPAALIASVVALSAAYMTGRVHGGEKVQATFDKYRAAQTTAALAQEKKYRAETDRMQGVANAAMVERQRASANHARVLAGVQSDADRMRNELDRYASGPADDTGAACRDRAAKLGDVLTRVLQDLENCSVGAESLSRDYRVLYDSWPR